MLAVIVYYIYVLQLQPTRKAIAITSAWVSLMKDTQTGQMYAENCLRLQKQTNCER